MTEFEQHIRNADKWHSLVEDAELGMPGCLRRMPHLITDFRGYVDVVLPQNGKLLGISPKTIKEDTTRVRRLIDSI